MTPTPLPYKPDWSVDEWVEYFKGRHPNFWFQGHMKKKKKKKKRRKADDEDSVSYLVMSNDSFVPEFKLSL